MALRAATSFIISLDLYIIAARQGKLAGTWARKLTT